MNANFRGKGHTPPTIFGFRKLESLGYRMVKKIAENFNRLSRVHQRHRQTDGIAIAYSERNVVTFAKNQDNVKQLRKDLTAIYQWSVDRGKCFPIWVNVRYCTSVTTLVITNIAWEGL